MRRHVLFTSALSLLLALAPAVRAQDDPKPEKKSDKPAKGDVPDPEDGGAETGGGGGEEAMNQALPWNPFEKAVEGDWESFSGQVHVETTIGNMKTDNPVTSYWKIVKVDADSVTVESSGSGIGGKRSPKTLKTFARKAAPTLKDLFELDKEGKVENLKLDDAKLTIEGKEFTGKKLTFSSTKGEGKMKTAMWLSPGVKGIGLVRMMVGAKSVAKGGETTKFKIEVHLAGYGNKDKADWGKTYKEISKSEGDDDAPADKGDKGKEPPAKGGDDGAGKKPQSKVCAFCGELRPVNAATCPHCGQK